MTFEALLQAIVRGELRVRLYENRLRYRLKEGLRPDEASADRGAALVYALAEHHDELLAWLMADSVGDSVGHSVADSVVDQSPATAVDARHERASPLDGAEALPLGASEFEKTAQSVSSDVATVSEIVGQPLEEVGTSKSNLKSSKSAVSSSLSSSPPSLPLAPSAHRTAESAIAEKKTSASTSRASAQRVSANVGAEATQKKGHQQTGDKRVARRQRYGLGPHRIPRPQGDSANESDGNPKIQHGFRGKRTAHRVTPTDAPTMAERMPERDTSLGHAFSFQRQFTLEESLTAAYREAQALAPVRHVAWVRAPISLSAKGLQMALAAWARRHPAVTAYRTLQTDGEQSWQSALSLSANALHLQSDQREWHWIRWLPERPVPPLSEQCAQALIADWVSWRTTDKAQSEHSDIWSHLESQGVTLCLMPLVADTASAGGNSVAGYAQRAWAFDALGPVLGEGIFGDGKLSLGQSFQGERYALALICDDLLYCSESSQRLADALSAFLMSMSGRGPVNFPESTVAKTPDSAISKSTAQDKLPALSQWESQVWVAQQGLPPGAAIQVAEQWLDGLWMAVPEDGTDGGSTGVSTTCTVDSALKAATEPSQHAVQFLPDHLTRQLLSLMRSEEGHESRWLDLLCLAAMVQVCVAENLCQKPLYWVPIRYPLQAGGSALSDNVSDDFSAQPGIMGRLSGALPIHVASSSVSDPFKLLGDCALGLEQIYQIAAHSQSALLSMGPQSLPFSLENLQAPVLQFCTNASAQLALAQQAQCAPYRFILDTQVWSVQVIDQRAPEVGGAADGVGLKSTNAVQANCVVQAWMAALSQLVAVVLAQPVLRLLLFPGVAAARRLAHRSLVLPFPPLGVSPYSYHRNTTDKQSVNKLNYVSPFFGEADDCYVLALSSPSRFSDGGVNVEGATSAFSVDVWQEAIKQLASRQPILRSVLLASDGPRLWGIQDSAKSDFQYIDLSDLSSVASDGSGLPHSKLKSLMAEQTTTSLCVRHRLIKTESQAYLAVLLVRPGALDRYSALRLMNLLWRLYHALLASHDASSPNAKLGGAQSLLRKIPDRTFFELLQSQLTSLANTYASQAKSVDGIARLEPQSMQHDSLTLPQALCARLYQLSEQSLISPDVMVRTVWIWCLQTLLPEGYQLVMDVGQQKLAALGHPYCLGPWHAQVRYWASVHLGAFAHANYQDLPALVAACEVTTPPTALDLEAIHLGCFHYTRMAQFGFTVSEERFADAQVALPLNGFHSLHANQYDSDLHLIEAEGLMRLSLSTRRGALQTGSLLKRLEAVLLDLVALKSPKQWTVLLPWERDFYARERDKNQKVDADSALDKSTPETDYASSVLGRVWQHVQRAPDSLAVQYYWDDAYPEGLSYRELFAEAMGIGRALRAVGSDPALQEKATSLKKSWDKSVLTGQVVWLYCSVPHVHICAMLALRYVGARVRVFSDIGALGEALKVVEKSESPWVLVADTQPQADLFSCSPNQQRIICLASLGWQPWGPTSEAGDFKLGQAAEQFCFFDSQYCLGSPLDAEENVFVEAQWLAAADALTQFLVAPAEPVEQFCAVEASSGLFYDKRRIATLSAFHTSCFQVEWLMALSGGHTLIFSESVEGLQSENSQSRILRAPILRDWYRTDVEWALCTPEQAARLQHADAQINHPLPALDKLAIWCDVGALNNYDLDGCRLDDGNLGGNNLGGSNGGLTCHAYGDNRAARTLASVPFIRILQAKGILGPLLLQCADGEYQGESKQVASLQAAVRADDACFQLRRSTVTGESALRPDPNGERAQAEASLLPAGSAAGALTVRTNRDVLSAERVVDLTAQLSSSRQFRFKRLMAVDLLCRGVVEGDLDLGFDASIDESISFFRDGRGMFFRKMQEAYRQCVARFQETQPVQSPFSSVFLLPLRGVGESARYWVGLCVLTGDFTEAFTETARQAIKLFEGFIQEQLPQHLLPTHWMCCYQAHLKELLPALPIRFSSGSAALADKKAWFDFAGQLFESSDSVEPQLDIWRQAAYHCNAAVASLPVFGRHALVSTVDRSSHVSQGWRSVQWQSLGHFTTRLPVDHVQAVVKPLGLKQSVFNLIVTLAAFTARLKGRGALNLALMCDDSLIGVALLDLTDAPDFDEISRRIARLSFSVDSFSVDKPPGKLSPSQESSRQESSDQECCFPETKMSGVDLCVQLPPAAWCVTPPEGANHAEQPALGGVGEALWPLEQRCFVFRMGYEGVNGVGDSPQPAPQLWLLWSRPLVALFDQFKPEESDSGDVDSEPDLVKPPLSENSLIARAWQSFSVNWLSSVNQPFVLPSLLPDLSLENNAMVPLALDLQLLSGQRQVNQTAQIRFALHVPVDVPTERIYQIMENCLQRYPLLRTQHNFSGMPGGPALVFDVSDQGPVLLHWDQSRVQIDGDDVFDADKLNGPVRLIGTATFQAHLYLRVYQDAQRESKLVLFFSPQLYLASVQTMRLISRVLAFIEAQLNLNVGAVLDAVCPLNSDPITIHSLSAPPWGKSSAAALEQWRYAARALGDIRARAELPLSESAKAAGVCTGNVSADITHKTHKIILSERLSSALSQQAQRISSVLGTHGTRIDVTVSDLVANAFLSCIAVFFEWSQQIVIDTLSMGSDISEHQDVISNTTIGGFFLPYHWIVWSKSLSLSEQIGTLRRLMDFANVQRIPYQLRADLTRSQAYRFFWHGQTVFRDESLDESLHGSLDKPLNESLDEVHLPEWFGLNLSNHLALYCVTAHGMKTERSEPMSSRTALYLEAPAWAGSGDEWLARVQVCLEAMASAAVDSDWRMPSPLLAHEVQCLRRALSGSRRIAKWPPLLSLLEQQISRSPLAPALHLIDEGLTLSYEQLSCLANWLAHSCMETHNQQRPLRAIVCWQVSHGQAVVAVLAALKLQIPFLIVPSDGALNDALGNGIDANDLLAKELVGAHSWAHLPADVLSEHALWVTSQPAMLETVLLAKYSEEARGQSSFPRIFDWQTSEWRDGSREDTPRAVTASPAGEPILTWSLPAAFSAQQTTMSITREAFTNQLMATTRDLNLGAKESALISPNFQSAQMLQLLLGTWLYGGIVRLAPIAPHAGQAQSAMQEAVQGAVHWSVSQLAQLLSHYPVSWVHLPYSTFCDVLLVGDRFVDDCWALNNVLLHADVDLQDILLTDSKKVPSTLAAARAQAFQQWLSGRGGHAQVRFQLEVGTSGLSLLQCPYEELIAANLPDRSASFTGGAGKHLTAKHLTARVWPRWLDNLHTQICLPDGRQAPPGLLGELQVCWPTVGIPVYQLTGDRFLVTRQGGILCCGRAEGQYRHRSGVICEKQLSDAIYSTLIPWVSAQLSLQATASPIACDIRLTRDAQFGLTLNLRLPAQIRVALFGKPAFGEPEVGQLDHDASVREGGDLIESVCQQYQSTETKIDEIAGAVFSAKPFNGLDAAPWPVMALLVGPAPAHYEALSELIKNLLSPIPWHAWPDSIRVVYDEL